ncbi:helix-turn-helix domain-containing protein [Photorhabdus temperata]|uniref:HTH cro/C1-type domain-containing protein n=2 Tax=Photorhabdus temperata TaxID=574560 RepID=A0A081RZA4_PHOTE|nr:helix-turn-helix domain-containing protein [Photorhabdus temperata]EQC00363.1 hypothetical protein B738_11310 [Photorhabdus temperata subsp. temperata M1021]ERT12287.1 hypothetical protein O185_14940 [Photorhabdus temperata J3]KER04007.1 hypothetical protein MEG1DRAFT_01287 [Photorhabdus temperata subsp. temperata Meg1]MCT8347701.1 helix-turn-helix domain-containing protein [Photorhabdus temperata]
MIGKRLKIARVNADLTQADLGLRAGFNEVYSPDFSLACWFAEVPDVPEAYFYIVVGDLTTLILQYHQYKKKNPDYVVFMRHQ